MVGRFYKHLLSEKVRLYLDISVEADRRVITSFQPFEGHWTLLLIIDEEDEDPACEVQQNSYGGPLTDATVRPATSQRQKVTTGVHVHLRRVTYCTGQWVSQLMSWLTLFSINNSILWISHKWKQVGNTYLYLMWFGFLFQQYTEKNVVYLD